MKPSASLTRKTPLRAHSKKWNRNRKARRSAPEAVIARDQKCQFAVALETIEWAEYNDQQVKVILKAKCHGPLTMHEPAHRRNVDPLNPDCGIALCLACNSWVEDHPLIARKLGLIVRGNGFPLSHSLLFVEGEAS